MKKLNYKWILVVFILFIACEKDDHENMEQGNEEIVDEEIIIEAPTELNVFPYPGWLYITWPYNPEIEKYRLYWTDDNTEPSESSNRIDIIDDDYYQHRELDYTKTYKYKLQAIVGDNKSALSYTVSASPEIPPLETPNIFSAYESNGYIVLEWEAVNSNGIEYKLKRKCIPEDGYYRTIVENLQTTSYTDQTIESGKGYAYKVTAVDPINNISSDDSDPVYVATLREVFEHERNNENISNTLGYDTHYWDAEETTSSLDWFKIIGGYSGLYSIYSSASYRSFDADCFSIYLEEGDQVNFTLHEGNMTDLWSMSIKVIEFGKYTSGSYREVLCHTFTGNSDSFSYKKSTTGSVYGCYLQISSWEDLINYGPYNYKVEIKIERTL